MGVEGADGGRGARKEETQAGVLHARVAEKRATGLWGGTRLLSVAVGGCRYGGGGGAGGLLRVQVPVRAPLSLERCFFFFFFLWNSCWLAVICVLFFVGFLSFEFSKGNDLRYISKGFLPESPVDAETTTKPRTVRLLQRWTGNVHHEEERREQQSQGATLRSNATTPDLRPPPTTPRPHLLLLPAGSRRQFAFLNH